MLRRLIERLASVRVVSRRARARHSSGKALHRGRSHYRRLESLEERTLLAGLTVAIAEASITESGPTASAIVSRDTGTDGDLVVHLASDDEDTATVPLTVTIPEGQETAAFTITGVDEAIVDITRTVTITASAEGFDPGSDTIDVTNDDSATLSIGNATVMEGDSGTTLLSFPVTLDAPVDVDVSVDYTTQDGTASAADGDYVPVTTPATLTIPAGETSATIDVTVNGDTTIEPDETLSVLLSSLQAGGRDVTLGGHEGDWIQLGQDMDGEAAGDQAGQSVSLSGDGNTLVIGAPLNDGNGDASGHARVYRFDGTSWTQLGQDIDGEASFDRSGFSVSLSGDGKTVVIGAPHNHGNGASSGHARVYRFDGVNWNQLGQDIDGEAAGDQAGRPVSLSSDGNTLVIGAALNDGNGTSAGHVRVYRFDGVDWTQLGQDIDGEAAGDQQNGHSVSLSDDGNTLVIGAPLNDGNGANSGHARVYRFDGVNWTQLGQDIDGEVSDDLSGFSVSLSRDGNTLVIGAPYNDANGRFAGHARVYRFDGTNWTQIGQDIDGEVAGERSGWSVSLNGAGDTVVIGAPHNDLNGPSPGLARVYYFDGATWHQLGQDIDGEAAGDFSGWSVSFSDDGNTLAIGAFRNDGNGQSAGHTRVYRFQAAATGTISDEDMRLVEFSKPMGIDAELLGGNLPQLLVTGTIEAGDSVTIDVTAVGGTATGGGVDYNNPMTVTIPAGTYSATPVDIAGLSIVPDTLIEPDETVELEILPGNQVQVGDVNGDGTIQATTLYTIQDDDLQNVRTVVELDDASILTIRDFLPSGKDDQLELTIVGDQLVVTDANNILGNFDNGTTGNAVNVPLAVILGIEIDLAGGDDQLSVDFSGAPADSSLSLTINGGDGHDTLTFAGPTPLGSGELSTDGNVEDIFVDSPIRVQSGTIALDAAQSLEVNADIRLATGSIQFSAGRDVFGNCSLVQAGEADVSVVAGTGIGNVRVETTGDVLLDAGSGGIVGCSGEITVQARTLTLMAGASVGSALLVAGHSSDEVPLLTSVDAIEGTVGGLGIFLLNDRPLIDNVELTGAAPMGIRNVCLSPECDLSEGEGPPLQNAVNRLDVNDDGSVSPVDALAVFNYLNSAARGVQPEGSGKRTVSVGLGETDTHVMYVDVNGDRAVSPLDALIVINAVNARNAAPAEGESMGGGEDVANFASHRYVANNDSLMSHVSPNGSRAPKGDHATNKLTSNDLFTVPQVSPDYFRQATRRRPSILKREEAAQQWDVLLDEIAKDTAVTLSARA